MRALIEKRITIIQPTTFNFFAKGLFASPHLHYSRFWLCTGLAMMLMVLTLSLISLPDEIDEIMWSDKLMHGIAYAGLMGWFAQLYKHDFTRIVLLIGLIFFGVGIELLQGLTPSRKLDVIDMVANASGVLLAWALSYTFFGSILERFEALLRPKVIKA